ncbi:hypothetical protein ACFVZH_20630 [Streptomyces sp. NPDC059534]|uniref:hypothetical protein n=1 Tax=Streptomyces sp. NPDC059534 TaxID=3346859 RepID=UPI00368C27D8
MTDYDNVAGHFASDVPNHKITSQREDGPLRYLRFAAPKTSMTVIEVVTWPHNLVVAGSHGSFHFAHYAADREDMLDAFRGRVNPDHWARMLVNGRDSVAEYDRSLLEARIREYTREAIREGWAPRGVGKAVTEDVLQSGYLDDEGNATRVVSEFEYGVKERWECSCGTTEDDGTRDRGVMWAIRHERENGKTHNARSRRTEGFDFGDVWCDWSIRSLDYHYVWQCHAIAWAVTQHDAARKATVS